MKNLIYIFTLVSAISFGNSSKYSNSKKIIESGRIVFQNNCTACHGEKGDGHGPAARSIAGAKPRDFTTGYFKFGSSPDEIFNTITKGSEGTAMPPWTSLPEKERWALVAYIKTLGQK